MDRNTQILCTADQSSSPRLGYLPHRAAHASGPRTAHPTTTNNPQTSTRRNSINMNAVDKAIQDLKSCDFVESFVYRGIAAKYGCSRSAVSRRWREVSRDKATSDGMRQSLLPPQELELVRYIEELHTRGLPPTREMIGSEIFGDPVSMSWIDRFLHRNHDHLISRWAPSIDRVRHQTDSIDKYDSYFDILHQRIVEHKIERRLTFKSPQPQQAGPIRSLV